MVKWGNLVTNEVFMYQPTLCIDVSKSKSFASAFLSPNKQFSKPFSFTHTEDGMKQVKVVLNPLTTSSQKRKTMRKVKTDPIDTYRIAQVYYLNTYSPDISIDEKYEELRNLCRQWDGINILYTETQLRFQSMLALVMPDLNKVFKDL
jgi:hypothetical protein